MKVLFAIGLIFFSALSIAGVKGYKIVFFDLSDGLGIDSINGYKAFLKENSAYFDDGNISCWKKRDGNGFDSIKTNGLDNKYFNKGNLLSVIEGNGNALNSLQEEMKHIKMELDYGVTINGADGVYVFQKNSKEVNLYGIPLKGNNITAAKLAWDSESVIPVDVFDKLLCKAATSMDNYFSP